MTVIILFNGIKDMSKLYKDGRVNMEVPFGGATVTLQHMYIGKEYCEAVLNTASTSIAEIQNISYQFSYGRIANEVFVMQSSKGNYTISCTIDTYEEKAARLTVKIESDNRGSVGSATSNGEGNGEPSKTSEQATDSEHPEIMTSHSGISTLFDLAEYDPVLENLKIKIKDAFIPDWNSCVWYKDEQSEQLCSLLYPYIFDTENKIRGFVNKVLIWKLGYNWLASPGLEKYHDSCIERAKDFRSHVPSFTDVDDALISATLEMLFELVKKGKVYESEYTIKRAEYDQIIKDAEKGKFDIVGYFQKHRPVRIDLWKDIFEKYFGCPVVISDSETISNSEQIITDFIKNRNHVAHNKPLTAQSYKRMEESVKNMRKAIEQADNMFESSIPSDELYLTWDALEDERRAAEEEEREREEYEQNYLRDRISSDTGVEILSNDGIFELLLEQAENLYTTIHDQYYFDEQFEISSEYDMADKTNWQLLCTITCKACEEYYIEVFVCFSIDDDMDSDSELNLRYVVHEKEKKIVSDQAYGVIAAIHYHNGSGSESLEDGSIILDSESSLDDSEQDDFLENLNASVINLNPYLRELHSTEYERVKEGTESPVADFPCWECGEYCVSIKDEFYTFGHCCYCGSDNEVEQCQRCGAYYGGDGGRDGFCEYCLDKIEKE